MEGEDTRPVDVHRDTVKRCGHLTLKSVDVSGAVHGLTVLTSYKGNLIADVTDKHSGRSGHLAVTAFIGLNSLDGLHASELLKELKQKPGV